MDTLLVHVPTEVVACEIFPFLSTRDLTALDAAVTNHLLRPQLFHIYQSPLCVRCCDCGLTSHLLTWFFDRSITLTAVKLFTDLDSKGLCDIHLQLTNNKAKVSSIKHLDISPCNASVNSNHFIKIISPCSGLESVNLSLCNQMTKAVLTRLIKRCLNLRSLDLSVTRVTSKAIISVAENCASLTSLNLFACSLIKEDAVIKISQLCPSLNSLDIGLLGTGASDAAVAALACNCPSLSNLNLSLCNITDAAVNALAFNCKSLRRIDLGFCHRVTDFGVVELAQRCSTLRDLTLKANFNVTDMTVITLLESCPSLARLDVSFCSNVTNVAHDYMRQFKVSSR